MTMDNVSFIAIEHFSGSITDFAIIDLGDGKFQSMTKLDYEAQQAEQSTPIVIDEAKAK